MTTDRATRSAVFAAMIVFAIARTAGAASLQQVSNWTEGWPTCPQTCSCTSMCLPAWRSVCPSVIDSCDSNASIVLGQASGLKSAADQYGFIIVVPQSNPSSLRCWTTDSTQVWTRDKGGDSNAIEQMVVYALSKYKANADRVYASGCSSGAMRTELLLALYPDIFKAGSSFAGMPGGVPRPERQLQQRHWVQRYLRRRSGQIYTPQQWGDLVRAMDPGYTGKYRPRLRASDGSADTIISYSNMAESESQYINLLNLSTNPTKTNTGSTLETDQADEEQWNNACGYLVLDGFESIGGDHGPSDALFVPQYVSRFLGSTKRASTDPEIAQCGSGGAGGSTGVAGASGEAGSGGDGERRTGGIETNGNRGRHRGPWWQLTGRSRRTSTGGASGAGTDGATASGGSPGTAAARAAEPAPGPPRCAATGDAALSPPLGNHSGSSGCRCAVGPTSAVDLMAMAVISLALFFAHFLLMMTGRARRPRARR